MRSDFHVDGYEIEGLLGAGPTGETWLAREDASGAYVALHRVRPRDERAIDQARRLVERLGALDHPHVRRVRELLPFDDELVFVLDHVDGGSLEQLLLVRGILDPGEVVTTAATVAGALAAAHERGLVHGDLRPEDILFSTDGTPLITDIGLAGITAPADDAQPRAYADPAEPEDSDPTPAGDVYSLAAICYTALTGLTPRPGETVRPIHQVAPGLPPGLAHAIQAGMQRAWDMRPHMGQFGGLLEAASRRVPVRLPDGSLAPEPSIPDYGTGPVEEERADPDAPAPLPGQPTPGSRGTGSGGRAEAGRPDASVPGPSGRGPDAAQPPQNTAWAPFGPRIAPGPGPAGPAGTAGSSGPGRGGPGGPGSPGGRGPSGGGGSGRGGPGGSPVAPGPGDQRREHAPRGQDAGPPPDPREGPGKGLRDRVRAATSSRSTRDGSTDDDGDEGNDHEPSRTPQLLLVGGALVLVVAVVIALVVWRNAADKTPEADRTREPTRSATPTPTRSLDPLSARWFTTLGVFDERRANAFAHRDPDLLAALYAPDSQAYTENHEYMRALAEKNAAKVIGLRRPISGLVTVSRAPRAIVFEVERKLRAYTVVMESGERLRCPAGPVKKVRIEIVPLKGSSAWRINREWQVGGRTTPEVQVCTSGNPSQ